MANSRMSGKQAVDEARKLIATVKGPKRTVQRVLALLRVVEAELQQAVVTIEPTRRGRTPLTYAVERTALGETLAEHRPEGSSQPFRCPKPVWDAIIRVLADAKKPLSAEEIAEAVEKRTGTRPGDHQYRVPLRLLTQIDPPLLIRGRARYRVIEGFEAAATALWASLKTPR